MDNQKKSINKDLILREKLAIQRTIMANQTTLLSFTRTSLYFLVAGLSIESLLKLENSVQFQISFYLASFSTIIVGIFNYLKQRTRIKESEVHIGEYKSDYLNK